VARNFINTSVDIRVNLTWCGRRRRTTGLPPPFILEEPSKESAPLVRHLSAPFDLFYGIDIHQLHFFAREIVYHRYLARVFPRVIVMEGILCRGILQVVVYKP